jgi:hypothetical protein
MVTLPPALWKTAYEMRGQAFSAPSAGLSLGRDFNRGHLEEPARYSGRESFVTSLAASILNVRLIGRRKETR